MVTPDPIFAPAVFDTARLLVIDDQQANLDLMGRFLRRAGYRQVSVSRDPPVGLALLDEHGAGGDGGEHAGHKPLPFLPRKGV